MFIDRLIPGTCLPQRSSGISRSVHSAIPSLQTRSEFGIDLRPSRPITAGSLFAILYFRMGFPTVDTKLPFLRRYFNEGFNTPMTNPEAEF
jgi:hypothetical protein